MFLTRLTSSPHFYTFLYAAIALLAAFNIFEVLFLLAHKRRMEKAEVKKEQLKHRITAAVITAEDPAGLLPAPLDATDHEAYSEAVASVIGSFEGEIAERARQLIYKFKIDLYYQRRCKSPVWYKRAHAVDVLSSLKLEQNRNFFPELFRSETSGEVKYRLVHGLSLLTRDREYLYDLCRLLSTLPYLTAKYTEDIFYNAITVLKSAGRETEFKFFLKRVMKDPAILTKVKRDCLSACHAAGCEQAALIVMEYYLAFPDEPEILIACVKSLVVMGDISVLPPALRHKDWRVRLTALKSAHLCGPEVLPELKALLRDANYHLRLNAALALARFGGEGQALLRAEAAGADKFAADAARYALGSPEAAA